MSGASSTSFFSFGPDDSFISKSFAELNFRNLPSSLRDLLVSSTVSEVHWAALGTVPDSWVLSSKDAMGKNSLRWGSSIPSRLQMILNKTWHSPHLRCFLGPDDSFIIWHPELIRWANLPPALENAIQSWLTPSGWRAGPPRIATWGTDGAFFAMSEYGDVVYHFGEKDENGEVYWEIFKETVEEWKAEKGFQWSSLSFIALDATSTDQFVAVRRDGTWAGSIDDVNEDALESFALNFWAKAKSKHKANASRNQNDAPGSGPAAENSPTERDQKTQTLYAKWSEETATMFASASSFLSGPKPKQPRKLQVRSASSSSDVTTPTTPPLIRTPSTRPKLLTVFPYLPNTITTCTLATCTLLKSETDSIHACQHDVERLLRASGLYSYEWLRQERLRWHPDRFGRLCDERWRETGKKMAGEMFKVMSALIDDLRAKEKAGGTEGP
ncbi:hypothetical protein J1614_008177 [Plenodomus biglobosus]|nr:hypothetical protein J1614_008177 [Plenodomus biglobosus]